MSPTDNSIVNSKRIARMLLLDIESRGKDATGFAFRDSTGSFQVHKRDVKASLFVPRGLALPKRAHTVICHTRAATKGEPEQNENNHPLLTGNVVGVHNGWLDNDEELWGKAVKRERRKALVDSEAIFAMLAHGVEDSGLDVKSALEKVEGNMAVAWMDRTQPDVLFLARGYSSPLFVANTEGGSVLFASTQSAVTTAAHEVGLELTHIREIDEGMLLRVERGVISDVSSFVATPGYSRGYTSYSRAYSWDDDYYTWDDNGGAHKTSTAPRNSIKSAKDSAHVFMEMLDDLRDDAENAINDFRDFTDAPIAGEAPWWSESWMSTKYFDIGIDPPYSRSADHYYGAYAHRESSIDTWFQSFKGDAHAQDSTCSLLKAFVRPGDYIATTIDGRPYDGEVVALPSTFPAGNYLLRVFVPVAHPRIASQEYLEAVLVERTFDKFTVTAARQRTRTANTNGRRPVAALTA